MASITVRFDADDPKDVEKMHEYLTDPHWWWNRFADGEREVVILDEAK